jgi:hypothetical protein
MIVSDVYLPDTALVVLDGTMEFHPQLIEGCD